MRKCLICQKEIEEDTEICETCKAFLKTKYGKHFKKGLAKFRESNAFLKEWKSESAKKEVEE